ncbi:hypothetical protein IWW47_001327 [Coemansia sp. RSA 2052]|nr:hypothetical protein IWW47_001327 [Coemansia sp. RSA 2052]
MASLLATVTPQPDTGRLDTIDDGAEMAIGSPSYQLAKSALMKLAADEADTAFSPLSSSAITIATLGSSLGYGSSGSGAKRKSGAHARQPVDKALGADSSSSIREEEEEQRPARQLGLRAAAASADRQDDSLATSSVNLSTAVSSSAVSSHSSKSSSSSAGPTMGMAKVTNMRSVSVDYARAYGLHMKRTTASATAADDGAMLPASPKPSPPPARPLRASLGYDESGVSSSATSLSGIHRTLTKRFWRPLLVSRKSSAASAFKQQPLAIDDDDEDLYPESKIRSSQDTCADNGDVIVERDSVANSSAAVEHGARPALPLIDDAEAATPHPSVAAAPSQPPRNYRFGRAAQSKSLDVARVAVGPIADYNRTKGGALNRRVLQRSKREDAIYGVAASPAAECMGPERFQALPRSFASRLGFASTLAARRRPDDLRFVIMPHPQFADVTEVYDCDERTPVYRKISRSGRSWHETFHEVNYEEELAELEAAKQLMLWRQQQLKQRHSSALAMSDYEMASALGLPYPGFAAYGGRPMTLAAAASCVTIQSLAAGSSSYANGGMSNQSTASFLLNSGTVRMARASTSIGASTSGGASLDKGLLWEALTPYPNQFPLHVKDMRDVIDSVSLASMVLDRHRFCYRFQLAGNKMKWIATRIRKQQLALQCFVRSTVVAEIFVDYAKGYDTVSAAGLMSNGSSGVSSPRGQSNDSNGNIDIELPTDGSAPLVTILPAAFAQLVEFESEIVESFILFSGLQMLECLHI